MRAAVYGRQSNNKAKSIAEQLEEGHEVISDEGWQHTRDYQDGSSASRYATKQRDEWNQLLADVVEAKLDVLILWESSRGDRTLSSWAQFLESCAEHKVRIHVITHDRTYDPNNNRDWKTLAEDGVASAYESGLLSIRTKRGHAGAAKAGLPPGGPTPYGYKRTFDPDTGKRLGQVPNPPKAAIVREIFDHVAAGKTILSLVDDLNQRAPRAGRSRWAPCTIREIVRNRAYISRRFLNGTEHAGTWPPIVAESVFIAAQEVLTQPGRRVTRPGRQKHLLSYLGRCEVCESFLNQVADCYRCAASGCVSVPKGDCDLVVAETVIARLSRPDAAALLIVDNSEQDEQNRAESARLRAQLDEWRRSAVRGETSPASLAVIETELSGLIAAADAKTQSASTPAVLRDILEPGVEVRARWNAMTVVNRRALINAVCEVRVGKGVPGRPRAGISTIALVAARLGEGRWHRDQRTWGETSTVMIGDWRI